MFKLIIAATAAMALMGGLFATEVQAQVDTQDCTTTIRTLALVDGSEVADDRIQTFTCPDLQELVGEVVVLPNGQFVFTCCERQPAGL